MKALALLLLPALALAAPPPPRHVSALLIPMDQGAEASVIRLESYMNEALSQFPNYAVHKPEELLGLPMDEESKASLERSRKGYAESLADYEQKKYEDAERKVRATLKELPGATSAMTDCSPMCEATALYGALLHERGDVEEARLLLMDLISLDPNYELNAKRFSREYIRLRAQVAASRTSQLRGNLALNSRPSGARVYVDGQFQGFTPLTVQALQIGKHLVRMERPGFHQFGKLVEVTPDDLELVAELDPTSAYKAYDGQLDKVASEVVRGEQLVAVVGLNKSFKLDRSVLGTVRELPEQGGTELVMSLFDTTTGRRMGSKRLVLQGDEFGQLKAEVMRAVNHLVNSAHGGGGEKLVKSSDPLEGRHGMEEWSAEDHGGKQRREEAKQRKDTPKDPLDTVNGTEDW